MNPNGIVFELNDRERFYAVDKDKQLDVYGPFSNSLVANSHMTAVHCTRSCSLIYKEDVKKCFSEDWSELLNKITQSRANPKRSNGGQHNGF